MVAASSWRSRSSVATIRKRLSAKSAWRHAMVTTVLGAGKEEQQ